MFSRLPTADESERSAEFSKTDEPTEARRTRRVRRGLEGGALATAVMTVYRLPVTRSLPPTATFWAKYVGSGRSEDYPMIALVLHVLYGVVAGAVFSVLLPNRESVSVERGDRGPPSTAGEVSTTLAGLGYGLFLSLFGEAVVLGRLLETDPDDRFAFHVSHLLYGITLGAWVGTRTRDDD